MQVNFHVGQQMSFINTARINQGIAQKSGQISPVNKVGRKDTVSISPQGKANSLIENLMKQKQSIADQKNSLISSALKDGKSMDSIQDQLKSYEDQLKNIDQQITDIMANEAEKQADKATKTGKKDDGQPKTKEEIQNEKLTDTAILASDLNQAEVISSVKTKMDGQSRILRSEIELDAKGGSSENIVAKKEDQLSRMEHRSMDLASAVSERLIDITEQSANTNAPQEVSAKEEASDENGRQADSDLNRTKVDDAINKYLFDYSSENPVLSYTI